MLAALLSLCAQSRGSESGVSFAVGPDGRRLSRNNSRMSSLPGRDAMLMQSMSQRGSLEAKWLGEDVRRWALLVGPAQPLRSDLRALCGHTAAHCADSPPLPPLAPPVARRRSLQRPQTGYHRPHVGPTTPAGTLVSRLKSERYQELQDMLYPERAKVRLRPAARDSSSDTQSAVPGSGMYLEHGLVWFGALARS